MTGILIFNWDLSPNNYTVVTETHGTLIGKRVVRGREADCLKFYETQSQLN